MERGKAASRSGLWLLLGFTAVAVAGFAVFGLRPDRLSALPVWAAGLYGPAFHFFGQGQVWLAALVLSVALIRGSGFRWVGALGVVYGASLASELLGTGVGLPFGEYAYSELLGPRWLERVPVVIPLSWFVMSVPSYGLARLAHPGGTAARVAFGSLLLLTWDLALDPAMSHAARYWVWGEAGPYYGMPWLNLAGWYGTGLVLMAALAVMRADGWVSRLPARWLAGFYLVNLLLPLGMCAAAGLAGAVVVTLGVLGVSASWLAWRLARAAVAAAAVTGGAG